jgi:hypothetical protein
MPEQVCLASATPLMATMTTKVTTEIEMPRICPLLMTAAAGDWRQPISGSIPPTRVQLNARLRLDQRKQIHHPMQLSADAFFRY